MRYAATGSLARAADASSETTWYIRVIGGAAAWPLAAHCPSDRDRAKLLPYAALKRRPAHVECEIKSLGWLVHETDHLRQVIVDDGLVRDECGSGKTGGELPLRLVLVGTCQLIGLAALICPHDRNYSLASAAIP
jgi:hypothetical protein